MLARSTLSRGPSQLLTRAAPSSRRGLAAAAVSNPFHYSVGESAGIKVASRDDGGPTTALAVVARGGSRYETAPGLAHGLEKFAFKNSRRSALRLQRETELLGGSLGSTLSRENIVLRAKFLRDDLPYFVEALADVLIHTKYNPYEFNEQVSPTMGFEIENLHHTPAALALEAAHNIAFHKGLGSSRLALTNKYLSNKSITEYSKKVYSKDNIAVVASGAPQQDLEKWTAEFFKELPSGTGPVVAPAKYYGGETRVFSPHGDAIVIAFPGSASAPSFKAEYTVLAYLLGGETSIKWNTGMSFLSQAVSEIPHTTAVAKHVAYTDTGLLYVTIEGPGSALTQAGENVVSAFKSLGEVKPEDVKKAIALAKFDALATAEDRSVGLESVGQTVIASGNAPQVESIVKALSGVTVEAVKAAGKKLLESKATFVVVGDTYILPYAEDLGLKV
ncbi:LuxS/MPP-like metallohydrolase [Choiromyces venosus 120613-1]|uniref:Cytochrome b-c1 complex subunit 2, mitochondrial n=1 Tax=Choiromyces venosus 120613-1 TaxID=1336337 RepID=A0A3N4JNX2_9PEZI|nr:LuxS/MPP-like metallohydrolase [Choiromyces venosus 120613-1]